MICPGATVPGGAPAIYSLSVTKPTVDPSHGSTLPGASTSAAIVSTDNFIPYQVGGEQQSQPQATCPQQTQTTPTESVQATPTESVQTTPTKSVQATPTKSVQATPTKSTLDKAPLPQPRLSVLLRNDVLSPESNGSNLVSSIDDNLNLTSVTQLSENNSTFFNETLSPSPKRSVSHDDSSVSVDRPTPARRPQSTYDGISVTSSLDTPLKAGCVIVGKLDLSLDTPVKEAMKARAVTDA